MRPNAAFVVGALLLSACAVDGRAKTVARADELIRSAPERSGALELHCVPDDAEVSVDGVPQGTCADFDGDPRRLSVGEGMHQVDVTKSGFLSYQTWYQPSGARAVLRIELMPTGGSKGANVDGE